MVFHFFDFHKQCPGVATRLFGHTPLTARTTKLRSARESRCAQSVRREFSCGAKLLSVRWLSARPHSTQSNQHAGDEGKTTLHKDGDALRAQHSVDAIANELRSRPCPPLCMEDALSYLSANEDVRVICQS